MKKVLCIMLLLFTSVVFAHDFRKSIEKLNNEFKHDLPEYDFYKRTTKFDVDISSLNKEQLKFYNKYVGSYSLVPLPISLEYDNLCRSLHSVFVKSVINGMNFYSFGGGGISIYYDDKDKRFSFCEGRAVEGITDLSISPLPSNCVKIDDAFFKSIIDRKKQESKKNQKSTISDSELRSFLIAFFRNLEKDNYAENLDEFFDFPNLKEINWKDLKALAVTRSSVEETFKWNIDKVPSILQSPVYVNTYFSESRKVISENFGDCTLVEFDMGYYEYFSVVIKRVENKLKIVSWRPEFYNL